MNVPPSFAWGAYCDMRSKCHTSNNYLQRIPFLWLFFTSSVTQVPVMVLSPSVCLHVWICFSMQVRQRPKSSLILIFKERTGIYWCFGGGILKKIKIFGNNFGASKRNLARHKMHLWVLTRKSFQEFFIKDFISSADSTAQSKSDSHICRYVYPKDHRYLLFSKVLW